jgi:hypothetical protein
MNHDDTAVLEALKRCARRPVILQIDFAEMFGIIGLLQLALRHPSAGRTPTAASVRELIRGVQADIAQHEPLIAEVIEMGFQPEHDTL